MSECERAGAAMAVFATAYALLIVIPAAAALASYALAGKQVLCIALPAIAYAIWRDDGVCQSLGLRLPRGRTWPLCAALIGASFWYLQLWLTLPALRMLGLGDAIEAAEQSVSWRNASLSVRLVTIVLVPALCEELLMRGVVARSFAPAMGIVAAIAISALLFAAFHFPAVRMVPMVCFGIVLAFTVLATDSIWPAVVIHALNNLVIAIPEWVPRTVFAAIERAPHVCGAIALLLTTAGMTMLWRSQSQHEAI